MKKKTITRVLGLLLAGLVLVSLLFSLTSCGGASSGTNYNVTSDDKDHGANAAAYYFARTVGATSDVKEKFIAAYRGYDMLDENFDDTTVEVGVTKPCDLDAARKVLNLMRDKITSDESKETFDAYVENLTEAQMADIIDRMKVDVDLEAKNGWVDVILLWIGRFLNWITDHIAGGFYAITIFLFALLIKIVFLPFSIKQQKNQIAMAKLQPKIEVIKAKYKGRTDQATMRKQQEEILALQQAEGYSPMSGCLPLLIQLPVIIALYKIVIDPLRYVLGQAAGISSALSAYVTTARAAGGLGQTLSTTSTIEMLSVAEGKLEAFKNFLYIGNAGACYETIGAQRIPNFDFFGQNLATKPSFTSILVLIPILAALSQWLTMFLSRKWQGNAQMGGDDQTQMSMRMMDIVMPLMTLWMAFSFVGMLGLYWIYQSVITILQTFILSKAMPMPKFTEEEIKAMNKAKKEAEKAQRAAIKEQPRYKSLHYIDEDDYDDLPEVKSNDQKKKTSSGDAPEIKD